MPLKGLTAVTQFQAAGGPFGHLHTMPGQGQTLVLFMDLQDPAAILHTPVQSHRPLLDHAQHLRQSHPVRHRPVKIRSAGGCPGKHRVELPQERLLRNLRYWFSSVLLAN